MFAVYNFPSAWLRMATQAVDDPIRKEKFSLMESITTLSIATITNNSILTDILRLRTYQNQELV